MSIWFREVQLSVPVFVEFTECAALRKDRAAESALKLTVCVQQLSLLDKPMGFKPSRLSNSWNSANVM